MGKKKKKLLVKTAFWGEKGVDFLKKDVTGKD